VVSHGQVVIEIEFQFVSSTLPLILTKFCDKLPIRSNQT